MTKIESSSSMSHLHCENLDCESKEKYDFIEVTDENDDLMNLCSDCFSEEDYAGQCHHCYTWVTNEEYLLITEINENFCVGCLTTNPLVNFYDLSYSMEQIKKGNRTKEATDYISKAISLLV